MRFRNFGPRLAVLLLVLLAAVACERNFSDDDSGNAADDTADDTGAIDDTGDDDTAASGLMAGAARVEITPDHPVILGGYGMFFLSLDSCRWSSGVHDPLYATAVAVRDRNQQVLLEIVLDSIGLLENDVRRIRQQLEEDTGVPADRIILSATHSHGTPDTVGIYGVMLPPISGRIDWYIERMIAGAVEAGKQAVDSLRPAVARVNQGEEQHYHFNQQSLVDPNALLDSAITVLGFYDMDGQAIATMTNWGCHPTVMPNDNTLVTADFVGAFYAGMDETLGGVNMFLQGNEGASVRARNTYHPFTVNPDQGWGDFDDVDRVGRGLAATAMGLLDGAEEITNPRVEFTSGTMYGVLRNPLLTVMDRLGVIAHTFPQTGQAYPETITAWRLGPLTVATAPGEVVPDIGLELRGLMDGDYQMVVNLAQDWMGYMLTPAQYHNLSYIDYSFVCAGPQVGQSLVDTYASIFQ